MGFDPDFFIILYKIEPKNRGKLRKFLKFYILIHFDGNGMKFGHNIPVKSVKNCWSQIFEFFIFGRSGVKKHNIGLGVSKKTL